MTNHRAIMAAHNNADWYSMMSDIHGLQYCRSEIAFLGIDSPPRYRIWMTTLDPEEQAEQLLLIKQNSYRPGFEEKDGFDCLDLIDEDFVEHFSATWIYADTVQAVNTAVWTRITMINELLLWEAEWKQISPSDQRQFPNAIFDRSDVFIWSRSKLEGFDAGVIANVSKDCIGLSKNFGTDVYPAAATLIAEISHGELPNVGYEHGDDLAAALNIGFSASGKLRIWGRP